MIGKVAQRAEEGEGVKICNSYYRRLNTKHGSEGYSRTQENCKVFNKSFSGVVNTKVVHWTIQTTQT